MKTQVAFALALTLSFTGIVGNHAEAAKSKPDLIVSVVSAPSSAPPDATIVVSGTVKNQGKASSKAFGVAYYLSTSPSSTTGAAMLGTGNVSSLAAGASVALVTSFTVPGSTANGTFYVVAVADSTKVISESNEANNTRSSGAITIESIAPTSTAPSLDYYVSPTGSDANPGTETQPFRTIQQALNVAQPGQTVAVMPGSYQPATFVRSGSTNAAITLLAPFGATLVGDGTGVALTVSGLHDIVIDGFDISNFATGIALDTVNNLVLRNNTLKSNTGVGIQGWKVADSLFEYNEFLDPGPPYPDLMDAIQDYGLNFYYSTRVTVTHNYFFGKHNQALSFKRQNGTAYIADNTFAGCMYTCIYLGQNDDDSDGDMTSLDSLVEHNTIQDATDPVTGAYYRVSRGIGIRNVYGSTVRNNTVSRAITAVETITSPQLWGQAAGNNQEYGNTVN